jgi:hypothetical protein
MITIDINGCWEKYFEALVHRVNYMIQQGTEGFDKLL